MSQLSILTIGGILSISLLALFMVIQSQNGPILELPMKWLWVSLVPVGIALFAGNFVASIETPLLSVSGTADSLPTIGESKEIIEIKMENEEFKWTNYRADTYAVSDGLMLTHEYRPSDEEEGQEFDIFIYLIRHTKDTTSPPSNGFYDVDYVEFYFGSSWDDKVFKVENNGGVLGVRTHAYGTFLALCRVHFKDDRSPVTIYRYIDFEMAKGA